MLTLLAWVGGAVAVVLLCVLLWKALWAFASFFQ
jgi:hypothetical protein